MGCQLWRPFSSVINHYMKTLFIILLISFLTSCTMYSECAVKGANWGYLYGLYKTKSEAGAQLYSMGGRMAGSRYCE